MYTDKYFFHPDHLGSSSYITNLAGTISQHIEYLPFGELLVEEHLNSHNSPFKFNAKELAPETGNYYYGARYYDPKLSIFLSVDPLFEKYPTLSPYIYTANNPVKYVDPDGRKIVDPASKKIANDLKLSLELRYYALGNELIAIIRSAKTNRNGDIKLTKAQMAQLSEISSKRAELTKSLNDINNMINDPNNYYEFRSGTPETKRVNANTIAMYSDGMGSKVHETRHGGQIARGEYDVDVNGFVTLGSYGASKEIDAYRAQLAFDGKIQFEPYRDYNSFENLLKIGQTEEITNFGQINNSFLEKLVDNPGLQQERIYGTQQDKPLFYEN